MIYATALERGIGRNSRQTQSSTCGNSAGVDHMQNEQPRLAESRNLTRNSECFVRTGGEIHRDQDGLKEITLSLHEQSSRPEL